MTSIGSDNGSGIADNVEKKDNKRKRNEENVDMKAERSQKKSYMQGQTQVQSKRQVELMREFAQTYHGLTALYKLLEIRHLQQPLFLPRTLRYRMALHPKKETIRQMGCKSFDRANGVTLSKLKFSMSITRDSDCQNSKRQHLGLLFAIYTINATVNSNSDSMAQLVTTLLLPLPYANQVYMPSQYLLSSMTWTFQIVELDDALYTMLTTCNKIEFKPVPQISAWTVKREELLTTSKAMTNATITPTESTLLFANLLRVDPLRRRRGSIQLNLRALNSAFHGGNNE